MANLVRLYRRLEGDLLRSGRIILQVNERYYDLTEQLFQTGGPGLLTSLHTRGFFHPQRFDEWMEDAELETARPIEEGDHLLPPLLPVEVGKIIALGKNYREHAEEFSEDVPSEPMFFTKLPECMVGHNRIVSPPDGYEGRFDHEVELAVIIGRDAKNIEADDASEYISGYTVANDLTLRSMQGRDRDQRYPWFRCKNFDGALPIGPCFAPQEFIDVNDLKISATVNGEPRQSSTTANMVVSTEKAIAFLSKHMTLHIGDLILMGTPAGVGPLEDGDEVSCRIQDIGELCTRIERPAS